MNIYVALIIGVIIGFLGEWVVDWFYWRRKARTLEGTIVDLQKENTSMENRLVTLRDENQHLKEIYGEPATGSLEESDEFTTQPVESQEEDEWVPAFLDEEDEGSETDDESAVGDAAVAVAAAAAATTVMDESGDEIDEEIDEETTKVTETIDVNQVEIIGEEDGAKLHAAGIDTPHDLIEKGSSSKGRADLAEQTGLSQTQIMDWVNHLELYEIEGLRADDAQLLKTAGIETVVGLATADPKELHSKMVALYADQFPDEDPPGVEEVEDWVQQAAQNPNAAAYLAAQSKVKGEEL